MNTLPCILSINAKHATQAPVIIPPPMMRIFGPRNGTECPQSGADNTTERGKELRINPQAVSETPCRIASLGKNGPIRDL
jgi:hypothetical protein